MTRLLAGEKQKLEKKEKPLEPFFFQNKLIINACFRCFFFSSFLLSLTCSFSFSLIISICYFPYLLLRHLICLFLFSFGCTVTYKLSSILCYIPVQWRTVTRTKNHENDVKLARFGVCISVISMKFYKLFLSQLTNDAIIINNSINTMKNKIERL